MREILSGNEAIARGAWEAGARFASAYPGTPSTEILENMAGRPVYNAIKREESEHEIEVVGRELRAMMPWLGKSGKLE